MMKNIVNLLVIILVIVLVSGFTGVNKGKETLLIIYDKSINPNVFSDYEQIKSLNYSVSKKSIIEILNWCYPEYPQKNIINDDCDTTPIPVWMGAVQNEDLISFEKGELLQKYCEERNCWVDGRCLDSWPSIVRSYFYFLNKNIFTGSLKNILIVAEQEKFPPVILFDEEPSYAYYRDLSTDPFVSDKMHTWDRNNNNILAELFWVKEYLYRPSNVKKKILNMIEENKETAIPIEWEDNYYLPCLSLDNPVCDDVDVGLYAPEVAIGFIPFTEEELVENFLHDSVSVEVESPDTLRNGLFAATSTFINHDTWVTVSAASQIWSDFRNYSSVEIFGEGDFAGQRGVAPYIKPNCGYFPDDQERCWFDVSRNSGFGYALFSSHGSMYDAVGIIGNKKIEGNLSNEKRVIYASVACFNMGFRGGYSSVTYSAPSYSKLQNVDNQVLYSSIGDQPEAMLFSFRGYERVSLSFQPNRVETYPHGFFIADDDYIFAAETDGEKIVEEKYLSNEFGQLKAIDLDSDNIPELIFSKDNQLVIRKYYREIFDKNNFKDYFYPLSISIGNIIQKIVLTDGTSRLIITSKTGELGIIELDHDLIVEKADFYSYGIDFLSNAFVVGDFNNDGKKFPDLIFRSYYGYYIIWGDDDGWVDNYSAITIKGEYLSEIHFPSLTDNLFITLDKSSQNIYLYRWDREQSRFLKSTTITYDYSDINSLIVSDINSDGFQDIILSRGDSNNIDRHPGIVFAYGVSSGGFGSWNELFEEREPIYHYEYGINYDNIGHHLLKIGDGRNFVGAIPDTKSSLSAALITQNEFTRQIKKGLPVGIALNNTLSEFFNQCVNHPKRCEMNYKETLWDYFAFNLYGDPTSRIH